MGVKCITCGRGLLGEDFVRFICPNCLKEEIIRCSICRKNSRTYKCKCGFEGP